jgi:hypothetical protein
VNPDANVAVIVLRQQRGGPFRLRQTALVLLVGQEPTAVL